MKVLNFTFFIILFIQHSFAQSLNDISILPPAPDPASAALTTSVTVPVCPGDSRCVVCGTGGTCVKLTLCKPSLPGCTITDPKQTMEQYVFYDTEPPAITTYAWVTGAWGVCSLPCGGGVQNRTVECRDNSNNLVADGFCPAPKPPVSAPCNLQSCAAINCVAQNLLNCILPATPHLGSAGACDVANGYTLGACSYTCNNGGWGLPSSNTCAKPATCAPDTISNCILTGGTANGASSGACDTAAGYTLGSCSYTCNNGVWGVPSSNTCAQPASCLGTTISNCVLGPTANASTSGACSGGYAGACTYMCSNGAWSAVSNTCSLIPPPVDFFFQWIDGDLVPAVNDGVDDVMCSSLGMKEANIRDNEGWERRLWKDGGIPGAFSARRKLCVYGVDSKWQNVPCTLPWVDSGLRDDNDAGLNDHYIREGLNNPDSQYYCLNGVSAVGWFLYDCPADYYFYGDIWDSSPFVNNRHNLTEENAQSSDGNHQAFCVKPTVPPPVPPRIYQWRPSTSACDGAFPNDADITDDSSYVHRLGERETGGTRLRLCLEPGITGQWVAGACVGPSIDSMLRDDNDGKHDLNESTIEGGADAMRYCITGALQVQWHAQAGTGNVRCNPPFVPFGNIIDNNFDGNRRLYEDGAGNSVNVDVLCIRK